MRTLESLYWFGVKCLEDANAAFIIHKNDPYEAYKKLPTLRESMEAVLGSMHGAEAVKGQTGIFIYPSYDFKVCDAIITNFHQPKSTLAMLVAAFIGYEQWKAVYSEALSKEYRFLSYGDSSFLERK
jgi:S-adenosylmethionine:tRNA ribosyltransferase-isomerase